MIHHHKPFFINTHIMIIIADGGSTKCDWLLLDDEGQQVLKTRTKGLNPAVFKPHVLKERLEENEDLARIQKRHYTCRFLWSRLWYTNTTTKFTRHFTRIYSTC